MKHKVKIYGRLSPYEWQGQVHAYIDEIRKRPVRVAETIVIKAARQRFGKSSFTKAELLRFALSDPRSVNSYVTPELGLVRKMFKEIVKAAHPFIHSKNGQELTIEFVNGSLIRFHSEKQGESLRGYTTTGVLIVDEGSSFKDTTFYEYIAPWVTVHKALTIIISTPKFKVGFFYESYKEGCNETNPYYRTFDWVQSYQVPIAPEDLAKKDKMPAMKWQSEYEGEFIDAQGTVFDLSGCFAQEDTSQPYFEIYLGLDFGTGSGKDRTVLTGINEFGRQVFIWATNDLSPGEQVEQICEILDTFTYDDTGNRGQKVVRSKIKSFYVEQNSIGKIYSDAIIRRGYTIHPFVTTNSTKRKLVENMQVAFQRKEVKLKVNPIQLAELSFYESKTNPVTNLVTYNAPPGMHDDHVIALMLAYKGYQENVSDKNKYEIIL
ncbi:MAG: hypothetical protein LIP08_00095 [Bacteroides sp.]|nr:hypothetical protein [Bacteroides sp.]